MVVVVAGGTAVVVVGAAVVLVVVVGTVVVVLLVEAVLGTPVVLGPGVVLVGEDPDWSNSPPQPARTIKATVVTPRRIDGDRRRLLMNPASTGSRKTPLGSLLPLAPLAVPTARLLEGIRR